MKKMSKIAAAVLSATMMASLLTGCSGGTTVDVLDSPEADFNYTGTAPITEQDGAKVSILAGNSWYSMVDFAQAPIVNEVADRAGVKIDWTLLSPTNYNDSVSPMLASGTDLPDIVELPDLDPNMTYINAGLFVPLDEYMDEYMPNYKKYLDANPDLKASLTAEDGHIYYVPQLVVTKNYQPTLMMNIEWLEQLSLAVPATVEEFVEVLRAFRDNDMNGNGDTTDEIPLSIQLNDNDRYLHYLFGPAFGLNFGAEQKDGFYADEDGTVKYAFYEQEKYTKYVTFLHDLYEEGLLEVEFTTLTRDQITERTAQNITGATFDFSWQMSQLYSAQYDDYDGSEGIMIGIPPLSGEYDGWYLQRNPIATIFGVSAKSDNILLAMKFLDFAMSEECQELYVWGIEGESYVENADGSKSFTKQAEDSMWLQALGINPKCFPSHQSVEATDVLLPEWHVEVDKSLVQYMNAPWPTMYSTAEEADIVSQYLVDITTYVEEMTISFITGTTSIDNIDSFYSTLENMNIGQLLEIRQAQYDRYMAAYNN